MAVQILPIIKVVAPYIAQVATAAIPVFTSRSEKLKSDTLVSEQIEELQSAATQNGQSIHLLAEKMQHVIQGLEGAEQEARRQASTYKAILFTSFGISLLTLVICIYLLAR